MSEEYQYHSRFSRGDSGAQSITHSGVHSGSQTPERDLDPAKLAGEWEYNVVAVGGTFDHLHDGHKLLLTAAGYIAKDRLIVGITGPELLKNKQYADAMQSYSARKESVVSFLSYIYPSLYLDIAKISDIYGPTATDPDVEALVVSKETRHGGDDINKLRREKGWNELIVYEVDLLGCTDGNEQNNWSGKLSSTELRRQELERLNLESSAPTPTEV